MLDKATAVSILRPQTDITELSFAAPDERISNSKLTDQEPLLTRPMKTKHGPDPRQQDVEVGNLEKKVVLPRDWQRMANLSLIEDEAL